ncbi:hypothetical protein [Mycobacterium sp. TY815]|uniref:hypothetical protein n=1 Tax=Mycobacterium sp. TY815 TaxID=3050581 RepID=UPI00274204EC|nr:hypothetical protein [Mycobacterium sp. TY815]MDP7703233.1 hypothetical protein [Mycobacterium sp. TY815]
MIETLLRAAGGAASFTLGSLWPMRWPAFPVAFFDFDMFNEPADRLWEESKERCAREARALEAQARELAAQTAIPTTVMANTVTVYERLLAAMITGDFGHDLADLIGIDLTSSAAGEASDIAHRGPTAEDGPALGSLPPAASAGPQTSAGDCSPTEGPGAGSAITGQPKSASAAEVPAGSELRAHNPAGHPSLTVGELEDAAYAVRRHVEDRIAPSSEIGTDAWTRLAEKLEAAAGAVTR